MTRINLLPWREIRRRQQDRRFLSGSIGAWVLMGLAVVYAWWHMTGLIDHQNNRNEYLQREIAKVEKDIKEINTIRAERERLIARMEVIQQLQGDRAEVVHVFDDLVRKLPKGVYFTALTKKNKAIVLSGFAQSNARISTLMRNLEASDWFARPNLDVINVTPQGGTRISKFTLKVRQSVIKKPKEGEAAPQADSRQPHSNAVEASADV
ncbi:MAG: PilN domain-containing protein [Gammaproteobacteria bacterium]|nr:PilN domain-containing protein [Gammaproteobacteria bacterium]